MRKQVGAPTGTQLHRAWRARPYRFRELACEPWLLACQPPEQRLALEAHDAPEAGRRHRGVVLRPAEDGSLVHVQHVRDLPSGEERRQRTAARAAPVHLGAFARLETRLLGPGGAPEGRYRADLLGNLRPDTGLSVGSNHSSHRRERLDWEHGPHLRVARLVPADAGNRPDLREEAGAGAVDSAGNPRRARASGGDCPTTKT